MTLMTHTGHYRLSPPPIPSDPLAGTRSRSAPPILIKPARLLLPAFLPQSIRQLERFLDVRRKRTFRERSDDG